MPWLPWWLQKKEVARVPIPLQWPFYKTCLQAELPPVPGGQKAVMVHDRTEGLSKKIYENMKDIGSQHFRMITAY